MRHVTEMSRTFSTSRIHREVIQAKGQAGSNQKSAVVVMKGLSGWSSGSTIPRTAADLRDLVSDGDLHPGGRPAASTTAVPAYDDADVVPPRRRSRDDHSQPSVDHLAGT